MKFTLQELVVVGEVLKCIPIRTPNRIDVILEYVHTILADVSHNADYNLIDVEINQCEMDRFQITKECLDSIKCFLPQLNEQLKVYHFDGEPIMPTIALPTTMSCCGKKIKILGRHATMKLYDISQVRTLLSYHGKCITCKTSYYHGYSERSDGGRCFNSNVDCDFLMFTSGMAFSTEYLRHVDGMICIGATTFEAVAGIYNHTVNKAEHLLNSDRIEAAWYVFRMLEYITDFLVWPRKSPSHELDVEAMAKMVYPLIKEKVNKKWIDHVCEEPGCKERAIIIDGNEKLYRFICATERTRVKGNTGEVNRYEMCIRNPVKGNKTTAASKFCSYHVNSKTSATEEQIDLRPVTRLFAQSITQCETTEEGCKKSKNIEKYYERTAGMFYIFRPCGVRLSHAEMYTSEACSDVLLLLIDTFGIIPDPEVLRLIGYDRVCDLHPFISRLSREGNTAAMNYEGLDFVLDAFHAKNHIEKKCSLTSPECIYHPNLNRYSLYKGMNTQIAEQSFNKLNKFKYITRKMSYCRRLLFFKFLDDTCNNNIVKV